MKNLTKEVCLFVCLFFKIITKGEGLHVVYNANAKAQAKVGGQSILLRVFGGYLFILLQQVLEPLLLYLLLVYKNKVVLEKHTYF